ncbi:cell division ATP-binding protein FtsE [Candidatus Electronema sp. JC]|jgi:cell division transport system ATP-binding protein|uniref:cell division ATP-binding protein FtsE n=1 Tax=Candidatus Electronema sp. JC TaxID=3401570 RepID=UPI003AA8151A
MSGEEKRLTMIDLARVSKTFPPDVHALADVSLRIRRGEMIFLTGQSGAGKTTLLRMLCGIDRPDKGYIEIAGSDLSRISDNELQKLRRRIGVAYQDFKLLPDKTVAQNIAYSMEVSYRSRQFIISRTKQLLTELGLMDKLDALAGKLSRGEQQRVSIARAVANEPELILADEPTGNLDAETAGLVMQLFRRCNEEGVTLLIATHDQAIYDYPGSKIVRIENGRLAIQKPPVIAKQGEGRT